MSSAISGAPQVALAPEDAALARMMGHARTKAATPRANVDSDSGDGSSSGEPEDEDDALERMMQTKRRVAFGTGRTDRRQTRSPRP